MIVRHTAAGWEIVFQGAHALLAGQFAQRWSGGGEDPLRIETLAAIIDHDDLKESFGKNVYLTDLGAPKDFTQFRLTARERFAEAKRRIESGYRKHRWLGLLASRHVEQLYGQERTSKSLRELVAQERKRRTATLAEMKIAAARLEEAYNLMQWCDRASLILCQGALPAMNRRIEIVTLAGGGRYEMWQNEDETVSVEPWPFREDGFDVGVEVRTVEQLKFGSDRELEQRLVECPVEHRRWSVVRG